MTDDFSERRRKDLSEFGKRLAKARGEAGDREPDPSRREHARGAVGKAFQVSAEMIAGIAVGGGSGWILDRWLDTSPLMLLVCLVLGFAAGIANVFRTLRGLGLSPVITEDSDPSGDN